MSKIAEVKTHPISIPLKHTLWTAHEELKDSSVILVEVRTNDGITGVGQIHGSPQKAICEWVNRFAEIIRGMDATASAVLSDLADAALDLKHGTISRVPPFDPHELAGAVLPIGDVVSRYYVRLDVIDRPGTLAKIAAILAQAKIGISSVIQPEGHEGESVPLILMIHDASNAAMSRALAKIGQLSVIKGKPMMIRVENFE